MASFCPYCKAPNCYNSGFTIECINEKCRFFSEKQKGFFKSEESKKSSVSDFDVRFIEEDDEDVDYFGYGFWLNQKP